MPLIHLVFNLYDLELQLFFLQSELGLREGEKKEARMKPHRGRLRVVVPPAQSRPLPPALDFDQVDQVDQATQLIGPGSTSVVAVELATANQRSL